MSMLVHTHLYVSVACVHTYVRTYIHIQVCIMLGELKFARDVTILSFIHIYQVYYDVQYFKYVQ